MEFSVISKKIKIFSSSHRHNLGNLFFLVVANFLAAALSWFTQVTLANTLGKEMFGQVAFGFLLGTYGQVIIRFGLDRTLVRDLLHHPERFGAIVSASLYLRYFLAILFLFFLLLYKLFIPFAVINWGVIFIAVAFAALSLDLQAVYDAWQKMRRHTSYFFLQKIIYLLLIWSVIILFPKRLSIACIGVSLLVSVTLYLFLQHQWAIRRLQVQFTGIRELFYDVILLARENFLVWLAALGGLIVVALNQPVLIHYAGFNELGGYAAAWQIMMVGNLFLEQIARIGRPAMARKCLSHISYKERVHFILKYFAVMLGVVLPLATGMIAFSTPIFNLVFKPEYASAASTLSIFGWYLLLYALGIVASQYILSVHLEKTYFLSVALGAVMSIFLCFILIPKYGSIGAALSLLLSHGTTMLIYTIAMVRHIRNHGKCD